jgi:hypothetical protein
MMPAQFVAEAREDPVAFLLYLDEIVRHETVSVHDEVEGTLGFSDAALAHDENPHPEDIE